MNKLANLNPAFMRFPGGSWVDGVDLSNAYHWQPTVGLLPDHTPRANIWGLFTRPERLFLYVI